VTGSRLARGSLGVVLCALSSACSGTAPHGGVPAPGLAHAGSHAPGNLSFLAPPARPRLALLARSGDPAPALVAVVATDVGPAATVALAAVVEARLLAAGLAVESRVDRNAFRIRLLSGSTAPASPAAAASAGAPPASQTVSARVFFAALATAFRAPLGPGTPEVARAAERLGALRRNPLPAPEAVPAADCAGRLGAVPRERMLDPLTPQGLTALEAARGRALVAERTALAAVGPAAFCAAARAALDEADEWPAGTPPDDVWPAADTVGTYAANDVARGRARVTVAVRVPEPLGAVSAAERLGDPHGPLRSRLAALPLPFHVTEVLGVARPRGGCISITAEADDSARETPAAIAASGLVAAVARKEIAAEAHAPADAGMASRAVIAASDPRDAAARAAWWALSGAAKGSPERWSTLLALTPDERGDLSAAARGFESALATSVGASHSPVVERRSAVEQGQGEVWILLASPCGTLDEGPYDAGTSALAALAVSERVRRATGLSVEPWVTPEGVGILAHAPAMSGGPALAATAAPDALARRVAGAAARAFAGELPTREAVADARALALAQIEKTAGAHGVALDSLLAAMAPEHPSQLHALGPFARLAAVGAPSVAARWQTLANGPLRMAVLANAGPAQANGAFAAADHWLAPRAAPRSCPTSSPPTLRPGRYEVELPPGTELAQALVAGPVAARGEPGRDLVEIAAHLLGGERGLVQAALDRTPVPAVASARLLGGSRAAALVIDVRAPPAALDDAVTEVKSLLAHLGQDGPTEQELTFARAKRARAAEDASFDPRSRLVKLWLGETASPSPAPTRAALQALFAAAFRDSALVLVEAKRK